MRSLCGVSMLSLMYGPSFSCILRVCVCVEWDCIYRPDDGIDLSGPLSRSRWI